MDIASKIKMMKEETQRLDEACREKEAHIRELRGLLDEKAKREARLAELTKLEEDMLLALR